MGDFPDELKRFIQEYLDSVEQLEVLLLLKEDPDRSWSAAAVSQAIYTQVESAAARLRNLHNAGLLSAKEGNERCYSYAPRTKQLDQTVRLLADVYKLRRVTVITLIYSKPSN